MFIESLLFDKGFAGGSAVENPPANAGDVDSIPGLGRSPGEGNATHWSIIALHTCVSFCCTTKRIDYCIHVSPPS